MNVYASKEYAESLEEFGIPRQLPSSGGWVLQREIGNTGYGDAIGVYPVFSCQHWSNLHLDLASLDQDLVSLTMVPEPFGDYDIKYLRECFPDLMVPFKQHYTIDLNMPAEEIVSRHHRKYARKALTQVDAEVCSDPAGFLDEWISLHQHLIARHDIEGIRAYSRHAFARLLSLPGVVILRAIHRNRTVGAQIWAYQGEVAYGHVLAFNEAGYKLGATYALYWFAINYFQGKARWCDLGGVAGLNDSSNLLGQFKEGWSTGKRTAYLCGRICNRELYNQLAGQYNHDTNFFPAYRRGFE
jgi:hypothetical protein